MYGTIAKVRSNPANLSALQELAATMDRAPGQIERIVFHSAANPNEFWLIAVFESEEAYKNNAASPEQHQRYLQLRALLETDPEWHDGTIIDHTAIT